MKPGTGLSSDHAAVRSTTTATPSPLPIAKFTCACVEPRNRLTVYALAAAARYPDRVAAALAVHARELARREERVPARSGGVDVLEHSARGGAVERVFVEALRRVALHQGFDQRFERSLPVAEGAVARRLRRGGALGRARE